jgi:hypothetical protein
MIEEFNKNSDQEFIDFFEKLGYKIISDGKAAKGEFWYELYDDGLVLQIDKGVPLSAIIQDLKYYAGVSKEKSDYEKDYIINGPTSSVEKVVKRIIKQEGE